MDNHSTAQKNKNNNNNVYDDHEKTLYKSGGVEQRNITGCKRRGNPSTISDAGPVATALFAHKTKFRSFPVMTWLLHTWLFLGYSLTTI